MTLDEAIKHAEEVAEEKNMQADFDTDYLCYQMSEAERNQCKECAEEHRQLAEWLKDYKRLKEQESKMGHWIRFKTNENGYYHIKCSECGQYWSVDGHAKMFKRCFNCGIRMQEEAD